MTDPLVLFPRRKTRHVFRSSTEGISNDISCTFSEDERWYVKGVDKGSDDLVIIIPDYHKLSMKGYYNQVFDIVAKYTDFFGLECAVYGSENPIKSFFELQKHRLPEGYNYENMFETDRLYAHIRESGEPLIGLEDRDLILSSLYLYDLLELIAKSHFKSKLKSEELKEIEKEITSLYEKIHFEGLPEYNSNIWQDIDLFEDYWNGLVKVSGKYIRDERSKSVVRNLKNEFEKREKLGVYQSIAGIVYGVDHKELITQELEKAGISYIVVGNTTIDHIVENIRKLKEMLQ